MDITIHYTAHLKHAGGAAEQTLSVADGATVKDCLDTLCQSIPVELRKLLTDDQGVLRPAILLCVDDEQTLFNDPAPVRPGAHITLLAAISGG